MNYEEEIAFGAFDSELMHQEIIIPEGFEAAIEGDKIILKKIESEDDKNKRISKEITRFLKQNNGWNREWLAWLEKQCNPTDEDIKEWNEEDEKKRELLIAILNVNRPNGHFKVNPIGTTNMEAMSKDELVSWLESLGPQRHWKPSDEQMKTLELIINSHTLDAYHLGMVQHLYNGLKTLKE